jgi:RecB family exonuclease
VRLYVTSSQVAMADNCRRQHWLQYIRRVKVLAPSANLVFGRALDLAVREFLKAMAAGASVSDPATRFREHWREARLAQPLTYAATQTPEAFEHMGTTLMRQLPGAWEESGFQVVHDGAGEPLIDRTLELDLGRRGALEVTLSGTIDVLVYTPAIELAVLDVKSAAQAHSYLYTQRSDQLTCYQLLVDAHRRTLGLPAVAKLGFWDFLKLKRSARIEPAVLAPPRSAEDLLEFREKLFWLAEDIARGRFPRASRMQFNTPCELCDYARFCIEDDENGLAFEGSAPKKPAAIAASAAA